MKAPPDVCSPLFEGTKGSSYGILTRKILEAQANTYSMITTNNKHGKTENLKHILKHSLIENDYVNLIIIVYIIHNAKILNQVDNPIVPIESVIKLACMPKRLKCFLGKVKDISIENA